MPTRRKRADERVESAPVVSAGDPFASALARYEAEVEAAPGRHGLIPRLAQPDQTLTTEPDALGKVITLQADTHGIVRPESPEQAQAADAMGLPAIQTKE